jgi:hypothetical protein
LTFHLGQQLVEMMDPARGILVESVLEGGGVAKYTVKAPSDTSRGFGLGFPNRVEHGQDVFCRYAVDRGIANGWAGIDL